MEWSKLFRSFVTWRGGERSNLFRLNSEVNSKSTEVLIAMHRVAPAQGEPFVYWPFLSQYPSVRKHRNEVGF